MDIFGILQNQLVAGIIGAFSGIFIGGIGVWVWANIGLQKIAKEKPAILVNRIALLINKHVLSNIKDNNLREQIRKDLDSGGDEFDLFWDKGLLGEKV